MNNEKLFFDFTKPTITYGIPTFNRSAELRQVLFQSLSNPESNNDSVHFLVIDDQSSDDTQRVASCYQNLNDNFQFISNELNLGFQGNFIKIINEATTDFIVFGTDDDFPVLENYQKLHELLRKHPNIGIVSSLWYSPNGEIDRGKEEGGDISVWEFRKSCAHLPGTVFNVAIAKKFVNDPRLSKYFLDKRNYYPQCFLALLILLSGYQGIYCPFQLCRLGFDSPSGIAKYSDLSGRWNEYKVFQEIHQLLLEYFSPVDTKIVISKLLELHEQNIFPLIAWGISQERKDVLPSFLEGAVRYASQTEENRIVRLWL
jgi:GT2 family glycosyltransferase